MLVVKLGGSVVTHKDRPETVDEDALERSAAAVADGPAEVVVVHGGGSFGHVHADRHGVTTERGTHDPGGALAVHEAMIRLNGAVVGALQDVDVPALPVQPLSAASRDADGDLSLATGGVATMLAEGFVPVLHGDVVAHAGEGVTIVSGDELVVELARSLSADRVGLCSTVPGVLDESGDVIDRIDDFEAVAGALGSSDATDVTGGMAGKVRTLLSVPVPASVFGLADLPDFLAGGTPGTLVDGHGAEERAE